MLGSVLGQLILRAGVLPWMMRRGLAHGSEGVEQPAKLEEAAGELEVQSTELGEQAVELEEQLQHARETADELERTNGEFTQTIAQREQAASSLTGQQHFLRQVIDTIPHFVFAKDRTGRFTLANEAVAAAYGT